MYLGARDVVKFGIAVGFAAIFVDASIAHGLFWDNDPYWTYWITKTFLITTVFSLGTAFLGVGIWQGLVLTAVHTLILEVYYQWLAPVGLPQEPEWLDFKHIWTTGVPAHYVAIFAGYLIVLWGWRRNRAAAVADARSEQVHPRPFAVLALVGVLIVIVLDGVLTQGLLLQQFPGITFFVQRLLIGFVFVFAWSVYVGFDVSGWVVGSLMLILVWTTYSMYLGPQGLPTNPPTYLGYSDLWLKSFPGGLVSSLAGLWLASRFMRLPTRRVAVAAPAVVAFLLLAPAMARADQGLPASAKASGRGVMVVGPNPVSMNSTQPMEGSITVEVIEKGNRWSHVQNTDVVKVVAEFTSGGSHYRVTINTSMPRHPLGKYTTWNGVVYQHEMHGETGIGTGALPLMKPDIALYGWAEVARDGKIISKMAPAHVMVTTKPPPKMSAAHDMGTSKSSMTGVMLEVDTEEKTLLGTPDGYITVMWLEVASLTMPEAQMQTRQWVGWAVLLGLVAGFWWLAVREGRRAEPGGVSAGGRRG